MRPDTSQKRHAGASRHERAVAQSMDFAQEAASRGDFTDALQWLGVVEMVDGGLPAGWEETRTSWLRGEAPDD